jgi:cyclase
MMKQYPRVIVALTLISEDAVKTAGFKNPKYLGDPVNLTRLFSKFEVDEMCILDISERFDADGVSRETLSAILESAFMPISFGGGITNFQKAKEIFQLGFDKVVIKSGINQLNLIEEIVANYGQQSVIACLDVELDQDSFRLNGLQMTQNQIIDYVQTLESRGVGELLVHDVVNEGTRIGYSLKELATLIADSAEIPVTVGGGIASHDEIPKLLVESRIDSVVASSLFVYNSSTDAIFISYPPLKSRNL